MGIVHALLNWLKAPEQASLRHAFAVWFGLYLFTATVTGHRIRTPELAQIADLQQLEELADHLLVSSNGTEWPQALREVSP